MERKRRWYDSGAENRRGDRAARVPAAELCSEALEGRAAPVEMITCSCSARASSLGLLHLLAGPIRNLNRPVTSETRLMG